MTFYKKYQDYCLTPLGPGALCFLATVYCISTTATEIVFYLLLLLFITSGQWQEKVQLLKHPLISERVRGHE